MDTLEKKSRVIGARVPEALYAYCQKDMSLSRTIMNAIFEQVVTTDGWEKLEELCDGFGPFKEYKFYRKKKED